MRAFIWRSMLWLAMALVFTVVIVGGATAARAVFSGAQGGDLNAALTTVPATGPNTDDLKPPDESCSGSIVSLSPAGATIAPGQSLAMDVVIDTPCATRGIQIGLSFDASKVQVDGFTEGNFYKDWAATDGPDTATMIVPSVVIDNDKGRVPVFGSSLLWGTRGAGPTGNGVVGTFILRAVDRAHGETTLTLEDAIVSLTGGPGSQYSDPALVVKNALLTVRSQ